MADNPLLPKGAEGPRQDHDLEMLFLSVQINHPDYVLDVRHRILEDDLSETAWQVVQKMIFSLADAGTPPTEMELIRAFEREPDLLGSIGGVQTIEEIARFEETVRATKVVDLAAIPSWAREIRDMSARRTADRTIEDLLAIAHDANLKPSDLWRKMREKLAAGEQRALRMEGIGFQSLFAEERIAEFEELTLARLAGKRPGSVSTGLTDLDEALLGGLYRKWLYIVMGEPGMGKTAFFENIATHVAASGGRVFFASLEMRDEDLLTRLLTREARVDAGKLRLGQLDDVEEARVRRVLAEFKRRQDLPFEIMDHPAATLADIETMMLARSIVEGDPDLIGIDYMELLGDVARSGEWEGRTVSVSARRSKIMAVTFNAPALVLSQTSRKIGVESHHMPTLRVMKWGGEDAADVVLAPYWIWKVWTRAGRVQIKFPQVVREALDDTGRPRREAVYILVPKFRHGEETAVLVDFDPETGLFKDAGTRLGAPARRSIAGVGGEYGEVYDIGDIG